MALSEREFREALYPKIQNQDLVSYFRGIDDLYANVDVLSADCVSLAERCTHSLDDRDAFEIARVMVKENLDRARDAVALLTPPVPIPQQAIAQTIIKPRAKPTYVYLMLNRRNHYTKIGYSTNPAMREATLQSEDPDVELLFKARRHKTLERELHREFASYRIRGEWFNLPEDVRNALIKRLSTN